MSSDIEKTSVQVAVRIRPLTNEDLVNLPTRFQKSVLSINPHTPNQIIVAGEKKQTFSFDHVFGPETVQNSIYEKSVLKLIDKFFEAYGQTSSGKTHTMGTADNSLILPEEKGIIPRAMSTLFKLINSPQYKSRKFSVKVSFIEIYNEDLIDLLGEGENSPPVTIREDSKGNILWSGLQELRVNNVEEVISHLTRGSLHRQTGATDMNSKSSRSHAIFSVTIGTLSPEPEQTKSKVRPPSRTNSGLSMGRKLEDGEWISFTSKFHFVDLAGSERLKRTGTVGDRAKEGISINSGLLALGNVISALGDPNKAKHTIHIPYRDSKLTRLLQDSLGGNAQTLMIACVSPAEFNLNETVNTLKYANRARNIKNSAMVNQEEVGWNDLEHLQNLVIKLRNEIKAIKSSSISSNGRTTPMGYFTGRETPSKYNNGRETPSKNFNGRETPTNNSLKKLKVIQEENFFIHASESFQEAVEPVIEEYEKSISSLESQLALTRAALSHSDTILQDQESKIGQAEKIIQQDKNIINDLRNNISKFSERGSTTEQYIKDLETKLDQHSKEQLKDLELIADLKSKIAQFKSNDTNNEEYIHNLEMRLANNEEQFEKLNLTIERLEKRLKQREIDYQQLQERLNSNSSDEEKLLLLKDINHRDNRIFQLEQQNKYQSCLLEINDLNVKLTESNNYFNINKDQNIPSTPMTPLSPTSSMSNSIIYSSSNNLNFNNFNNNFNNNNFNNNDLNKFNDDNNQSISASKFLSNHQRSKSHTFGDENQQLTVVQKLYNELKQLSSLHDDKAQGLEIIKQEFTKLEISYHETLEIIEELREEIKSRDNSAQNDVMSSYSVTNSNEIDQLEIVQKLRGEVNQLKEERRKTIEIISKYQMNNKTNEANETNDSNDMNTQQHEIQLKPGENANQSENNNEEILALKQKVEKFQTDIQSKSHTIATLLLSTSDHHQNQNTIRQLEDELQEVREAYRLAIEGKLSKKLTEKSSDVNNSEKNSENNPKNFSSSNFISESSSDKLEQNVDENVDDENVRALEDWVRDLESQLTKAKDAQNDQTSRNSLFYSIDPTHKNINKLQEKLYNLLQVLISKSNKSNSDKFHNFQTEQELINSLQVQLEILKADVKNKYELIELMKKDLTDKNLLHQKLREKESEATILQSQLSQYSIQEQVMQMEIKELQSKKIEFNNETNESLLLELNEIKQELKESRERESAVLNQLKLRSTEESKLLQDIENMRKIEITQRERIILLESELAEKDWFEDDDLNKLRTELALVREAEIVNSRTIADLEKKLSFSLEAKEELITVKKELKESKATDFNLQQTIKELEQKLELAENQSQNLSEMKKEIILLKDLDNEQKTIIKNLESQIQETRNAKDSAIKELKDLKDDFNAQQELVIALESELTSLNDEWSKTKQQNESFKSELDQLIQHRDKYMDRIKELENLSESLKVTSNDDNNNLVSLRDNLANVKLEMEAQNQIVTELGNQMISIEKERDQLIERLAELTKTLEIKELNHKETVSALENQITDLQSQLEEIKNLSTLDQEKVIELNEQLVIVETQLQEAKENDERRSKLVSELERKLLEREQLKNSLPSESEMQEYYELKSEMTSTIEQLNELKSNGTRQTDQIMSLESQLQEAKDQHNDTVMKLENANKEIEELTNQITQLQNMIIEANDNHKMMEVLKNDLGKAQNEIQEYSKQVKELEKINQQFKLEDHEKLKINDELAKQVEELQNDLETLTEEFSNASTKYEDSNNKLQEQREFISGLEETLKIFKRQKTIDDENLESSSSILKQLAKDNENLRNTNDNLNSQINTAESHSIELSEKIKYLEDEIANLNKESTETVKEKIYNLESERDELKRANKSLTEERHQLETKIESLTQKFQLAGQEENETTAQLTELNTKVFSLEEEISQLKEKSKMEILEMEKEIIRLIEENDKLIQINNNNDMNNVEENAAYTKFLEHEKISKLQEKISSMEYEKSQNNEYVETLETSLNDTESNLRMAKKQLQSLQQEKAKLISQVKALRTQLEEATIQFENAKNSVQEEKKVIESVLEEERKAKESAEKARSQLEYRMEELMAKKNKFICF
ncbi:11874_t:CDS:2 [Diversispora eburnea]|uniref:11874_t:CDS:1 n=1 Tax=Diversispora eburnea TaxID=1213867 RepID=A0A9N8VMS6_9GLOM|nr:11874_t:CDS:2 [Diversispora eburnea]